MTAEFARARLVVRQDRRWGHDETKARLLIASRRDGAAGAVRELAVVAEEWALLSDSPGAGGAAHAIREFGFVVAHEIEGQRVSLGITVAVIGMASAVLGAIIGASLG